MDIEVKLPDLGEDAPDHATMSFFYFEEGDKVGEGDDFAELVTDKASFTVPSPASGIVIKLMVGEGDKVDVGQVMAVLNSEQA